MMELFAKVRRVRHEGLFRWHLHASNPAGGLGFAPTTVFHCSPLTCPARRARFRAAARAGSIFPALLHLSVQLGHAYFSPTPDGGEKYAPERFRNARKDWRASCQSAQLHLDTGRPVEACEGGGRMTKPQKCHCGVELPAGKAVYCTACRVDFVTHLLGRASEDDCICLGKFNDKPCPLCGAGPEEVDE